MRSILYGLAAGVGCLVLARWGAGYTWDNSLLVSTVWFLLVWYIAKATE